MNTENSKQTPIRIIFLVLALITVGILYRESLGHLLYAVMNREGSSHGIFVPFISAYFIWLNHKALAKIRPEFNMFGLIIIAIGLVPVFFSGWPYQLHILGFIIYLSGAVLLILGWSFYKEISFPLYFLISLTPIPDDIYLDLAETIRVISFGGSRIVISILGIPFFHEGNLIHLHNATLEVAIGCSGIRYLVSYFVFSFAYAYLFKSVLWSRLAVVVSSIFISLIASVGRLSSIFILTHYISPKMAEHWPHVIISWTVFFVVLIIAIGADQYFQNRKDIRQD
ncbi:MAG: exosortase/archaeosortase family protein [Deltaproteobacteria bacterium]|nr:exosortase/archaeosortase family protein [Deltaproteobacteria bacterium]